MDKPGEGAKNPTHMHLKTVWQCLVVEKCVWAVQKYESAGVGLYCTVDG